MIGRWNQAEEMAVVEGKAPRASKRKTAVTVAGVASSAHDVGCVPLPFGPFWGPLLVATGGHCARFPRGFIED